MKPHEERVVVEAAELAEKIEKLAGFFETDTFLGQQPVTQHLMKKQFCVMSDYWDLLQMRISMFERVESWELLQALINCTTDEGPEQEWLNRSRELIAKATGASA